MTIEIKGENLTIEDVNRIARDNEKVKMSPEAVERI